MKKTLMYQIKPDFQKKIFVLLIKKFGSSAKAGAVLKIPASSVRGYKNLYFDTIPHEILKQIISLNIISQRELESNLLAKSYKEDKMKENLGRGITSVRDKFLKLHSEIPPLNKIMQQNSINFLKWFDKYQALLDSGFRKSLVTKKEDYFTVSYKNFNRKEIKDFSVNIPYEFELTEDFIYFFGLWCGDRVGGKRFGVCNKNPDILLFTEEFLKKNYQTVEKILLISQGLVEPPVKYDKKVILNHDKNGWVLAVHSSNGILSSFFHYLQSNLREFLSLIKNKEPFFAGLFDAEGNVSLYNKSFRWACKNEGLIRVYKKFLRNLKLFDRYDGDCLISYNKAGFYSKIMPHLKHRDKINLTRFMINGSPLPDSYRPILESIESNPQSSAKGIAKALKKTKVYSELRLLNDFNYITRKGYPSTFELTGKGKNIIRSTKL